MLITAECPVCGFKGSVPDQFAGKKVKCRSCCNMFTVGATPSAKAAAGKSASPTMSGMNTAEGGHADAANPFGDLDAPEPSRPAAQKQPGSQPGVNKLPPSQQGIKKQPGSQPGVKKAGRAFKKKEREPAPIGAIMLGALAVVLSVAGLIIAPKGLIGLGSVPVAGLGLMLGIGGVVTAWGRPGLGILAPVLGVLMSLIAVPVGGYQTYKLIASGALNSADDLAAKQSTHAADENKKPVPGSTDQRTAPPTQREEAPPPPPPPDQWVDARQGYRLGRALVKVVGVEVDTVRSKDGKEASKNKQLILRLQIENKSGKDIDYFGWGTSTPRGDDTWPKLSDDNDAQVPRFAFDNVAAANQLQAETLPPGKTLSDVLIFDVPPDTAKHLRLELAATNIGETGKLKLQLPLVMLSAFAKNAPRDPRDPPPKDDPKNPKTEKFIQEQRANLKKPKPQERIEAAVALGDLGTASAVAAPELADLLKKDRNEMVRAAAAEALGKIGPAAKPYIPTLIGALKDEFWKVKANAARALGQFGAEARAAVPELEKLAKSKDEEVPDRANEALRKITGGKK